jgi:hypothetical protein
MAWAYFFHAVPKGSQASVQTLHKRHHSLVAGADGQSMLPIHNCFFLFFINSHPLAAQKLTFG